MIVADGLIAFLTQDGFVSLLNRLVRHFPSGELAFNLYTRYAIWAVKHAPGMAVIAGGVVNPGFDDPRQPERWVGGLKLVRGNLPHPGTRGCRASADDAADGAPGGAQRARVPADRHGGGPLPLLNSPEP